MTVVSSGAGLRAGEDGAGLRAGEDGAGLRAGDGGAGLRAAESGAGLQVAEGGAGLRAGDRFDVARVRAEFPLLARTAHGKPLVYLDSAATSQKPRAVLEALARYYTELNANIHRGLYQLSQDATEQHDEARRKVQRWLGAEKASEVIFTSGTTASINLVAQTFGRQSVREGDEIIISGLEHHSNIVPWQLLCEEKGAALRVIPTNDAGELLLDDYERLLSPRTRLVAIGHVSNALGTVNPVKAMIATAHARGVKVLVDGAQAVPHMRVDVRDLDADFYAFSGHKLFGPTGIGVLYGKQALLEAMPPWQGGGDMILSVTFEKTLYNVPPYKFEAGTPHIAGAIGLGAAIDYLDALGFDAARAYEHDLLDYAHQALAEIPDLRIVGTAAEKEGVVSFVVAGIHPHDMGTILDAEGIAVRAGHHCAQPVMARFGLPATTRASLAFYNTREEIDALVRGIHKVREMFR
ncbi:MAG: cysteine desulfurase [Candidatus Sericytochromatia bacterium]|nr:cysteine desulfurase [Candidatus Tanganyikabacteria bacterium]